MEKAQVERTKILSKPVKGTKSLQRQFSIATFSSVQSILKDVESVNMPRIKGKYTQETYSILLEKYSTLPKLPVKNPKYLLKTIITDLLGGVPLWRKPTFQYNVGAAVSRVSSALYSIGLDLNIFNINDGLSGNAIIAEQAVTKILAELAGVDHKHSCGFFTFGGTATNLYAIKLGLAKAFPESRKVGLPTARIRVVLTEDAHFSHLNALNWLGVGVDNALVVKADNFVDLKQVLLIPHPDYLTGDNAQGLRVALDLIGYEDTLIIDSDLILSEGALQPLLDSYSQYHDSVSLIDPTFDDPEAMKLVIHDDRIVEYSKERGAGAEVCTLVTGRVLRKIYSDLDHIRWWGVGVGEGKLKPRVAFLPNDAKWIEVDTSEEYEKARELFE